MLLGFWFRSPRITGVDRCLELRWSRKSDRVVYHHFANPNPGRNDPAPGQGLTGTLTGTYSSNPDGTGQMNLTYAIGLFTQKINLAMVITDGGDGLQIVETDIAGKLLSGTARTTGTVSGIPPNTRYGFQINRWTIFGGQQGVRPDVIIGLLNFDGADNASVASTEVLASQDPAAQTATFNGTYTTNADGTGQISLAIGAGQTQQVGLVITDSGAACYLLFTTDDPRRVHTGIARRQ